MPRCKVVVNLPDKPAYDVRIGTGILEDVGGRISEAVDAPQALVITDGNVAPLYLEQVRQACRQAGIKTTQITVAAGEESKSIEALEGIWRAMAQSGMGRDTVVVALGGGVVGDLAGFVAATFMRGISLVQLPTTLLAMVDSSVGGKTAVNLPEGKNLVGAFKQPDLVCADTETLATLDDREWACGCAEIAKSALIDSDEFFFWLTDSAQALAERDEAVVQEAIMRCVVFKADVVAADETESAGVRECLNYGHTLGHAVEKLAGFGTYSHGAAVAEGMRFALRLAVALVDAPLDLVEAQDSLLDQLGLPSLDFSASADEMLEAMHTDKKTRGGVLRFVLPSDVGRWTVREVDDDTVREHLQAWERSKR